MRARPSPRAVLWLVLVLALVGQRATARAEELSADELVQEIARARQAVARELERSRDGRGIDTARLRAESARLEGAQVRTPHGPIEADPQLEKDLGAIDEIESPSIREEKLAELAHKLDGIEHEARRALKRAPRATSPERPTSEPSPGAPERPSAEDARKVLGKVLERPHYRRRTAPEAESSGLQDSLDSLWQRFLNWVERFIQPGAPFVWPAWIQAIFTFLAGLLPASWAGVLVWFAAIALLVVGFAVWRARKRAFGGREEEQGGFDGEKEPARTEPEDSYSEAHWRREARLLAERGELRGAVRALYTGVLLVLQRGGLLKFDKGKTNWEHLRELRRHDRTLAASLEPLTRTFDVAWYGRGSVERGTYDEFLARTDELARAVEKTPGVTPPKDAP